MYLPATHSVHEVLPVTAANRPDAHGIQLSELDLPARLEYLPVGQGRQATLDVGEYVPGRHSEHTDAAESVSVFVTEPGKHC